MRYPLVSFGSSRGRSLVGAASLAVFSILATGPTQVRADGMGVGTPAGGVAGIAAGEVQRRQSQIDASQKLFTAASAAFADKSYGEAMDYYKASFETLPEVPATADMRSVFFKRYETASLAYANQLIEQAEWLEAEQTLSSVLETARLGNIPVKAVNYEVRTVLGRLKSKDYYNMANSPQHLDNVEAVESQLILAQGYLQLGDYDRAERAYNRALDIDPYNEAARKGLESTERHRVNYFDAARDQTRATKLREVAEGWETPVTGYIPGELSGLDDQDLPGTTKESIEQKLKNITVPRLEFTNARLVDVLEFLGQKSVELDTAESDPAKRGVNIIVDSTGAEGEDPSQNVISLQLSNVPLGVAIRYATQSAKMKFRVDNYAVTVIPESVSADVAMISRSYVVPPGFIQGGSGDGGGADSSNDPFADPDAGSSTTLVKRISAQEFLEQRGVVFGEGAVARYIAPKSTLVVRNTAEQLALIESLIQSSRESGGKMVQVGIKIISVKQDKLREIGFDHLLGPSNLGSSPRVFVGGGTDGNAAVPTDGLDYTFRNPGTGLPVGLQPITGGLRTGDFRLDTTIDDLLTREQTTEINRAAPATFSVAGVFTDPQFQSAIRLVNQSKGADFLCDTKVLVQPGQRARVDQVREFIYPTEYDPPEIPNNIGQVQIGGVIFIIPTRTFPATPANPTAFETRPVGKSVEVEPTVSADNTTIVVNLLVDFSDFIGFINYGTPITNGNFILPNGDPSVVTENRILMPVFDAVRETTEVVAWDGATIVIGGLHGESVDESQDKIPLLGDLPVLGKGFRSETAAVTKRGVLIFVTVNLFDPGGNPINNPLQADSR